MPSLTRRHLLAALPALGTMVAWPFEGAVSGQAGSSPIRVRSLNHFEIAVADPKRAIDFYQGLFGMPVQSRTGSATILRVGAGRQFLSIRPVESNTTPRITHYSLGVEDFNVNGIITTLAAHGVVKADAVGPMKVSVTRTAGNSSLLFGDPDGILCQLLDASYCGGAGPRGNECPAPEASSKKGLIALAELSHLTIFSGDAQRSNIFYQNLFGFSFRSYQGPTAPTLAVGPTVQFLMFAGGGAGARGGALTRPANINHACWSLESFKPDAVLKTLESYGLKPREGVQGPAGPLRHYVTMRMENRGGAPGGTPELYFTDPDGLLMQLQDTSYCGGSGFLGNECPKV
jgi:catechol 2,3-dioxygenase-like lactoylglutathione lyase family enzyme